MPQLDAEVARLEAERFAVFEDCVEAELAAGRHADLVGELQAAVAEHPLRERLVGLLMTALWRVRPPGRGARRPTAPPARR